MKRNILSFVMASALGISTIALPFSAQAAGEASTYTVKVSQMQGRLTLGGTIVPLKQVTLAAQIPGRVVYIAGAEGSKFPKGTVLVGISEEALRAQRQAALAGLASARAQLRNAEVQYRHERSGKKSNQMMRGTPMDWMSGMPGTGSGSTYADKARAQSTVQSAKSAVNTAISNIQAIDAKFRDAKSIASMDGVIVKKFVEVGATVQPGQPLLQFAQIKFLQVKMKVPARQVGALKVGDYVEARLNTQGKTIPVKVAQIAPLGQQHSVEVKLDVPTNSSAAPGMYVEVIIPNIHETSIDVMKVPKSAVKWGRGLAQVYVMRNGKPALKLIRLGDSIGDEYRVLSGIAEGDVVLTNPDRRAVNTWERK